MMVSAAAPSSPPEDDDAATVSVLIPAVLSALAYVVVFELLRGYFPGFFAPRWKGGEGTYPFQRVFSWVYGVWKMPEEEVLRKSGMDAVVYLHFIRMAATIMTILSFIGLVILVPIFSQGKKGEQGLSKLTLANISQSSDFLWAPAIVMWIATIISMIFTYSNYLTILDLRRRSMKTGGSSHYTVMIYRIPESHNTAELIKKFLDRLYPGQVAFVSPVYNRESMRLDCEELKKEYLAMLKAKKKNEDRKGKITEKLGFCGCFGEEVESERYHEEKVEELQEKITSVRDQGEFCNAAFVTFKLITVATKAADTTLTEGTSWQVKPAPKPRDILWENMCNIPSKAQMNVMSSTSYVALVALIIFWAIPVALGGALSDVDALANTYPAMEPLAQLPSSGKALIEGFGPTLWRVVIMILVQPIIRGIIYKTGVAEGSQLEIEYFGTYYVFLLVNIYFVTLISSSVFSVIQDAIKRPLKTFELLGAEVPQVSAVMIQYMMLQGLAVNAQKLIRMGKLFLTIIFASMADVDYELREAMKPYYFQYGTYLAFGCLIFTISCCYSTVAPIILPFATIYFSFDYLIQKYQLLYVHTPSFETYGMFWPVIIKFMLHGLVLAQSSLMIILGLKFGYMQQFLLFPLPIVTWLYSSHLTTTFGQLMTDLSMTLSNAANLDSERPQQKVTEFLNLSRKLHMWEQPCMRLDVGNPLKEVPKDPEFVIDDEKIGDGEQKRRISILEIADQKSEATPLLHD